MSKITDDMKMAANGEMEAVIIKNRLEKLFYEDRENVNRYGLHASAIIESDERFCYRAQLLSLFYKQNQGQELPIKQLKIFAQGNAMHEKWYKLFRQANVDVAIERTLYLEKYDLSFTIDALLNILNEELVCDVKSQSTFQFRKTKRHPSGEKQVNFYLWALSKYTGVLHKKGFVLVDSKDDQDIRVVPVHLDNDKNKPYIERLKTIQEMKQDFMLNRIVPPRKCKTSECKLSRECNMRDACWNIGIGRKQLEADERKPWAAKGK